MARTSQAPRSQWTAKPRAQWSPPARAAFSRLDFLCPAFGCADGYGHSAEQMALALERAQITVRIVGMVRETGHVSARHLLDRRHALPEGDALVSYSQPNSWMRQIGRKSIGFSMYETDDLPLDWYNGLHAVDEIWVPTMWQIPVFSTRSGGKPTYCIPLAVDAAAFPYRRRARGPILNFLHFATCGGDIRKGSDLAVRAFRAAFPDRNDVKLTLRSQIPYEPSVVDHRISVSFGVVTPAQLLEDYYAADALIYPSRGEGFGMIPLEAMCSGMPAIYADASGPHDYAGYGLTVPATYGPTLRPYLGNWWEPEVDALVERMREVDEYYDIVMDKAELDAASIAETWTWDRTAAAMIERLRAT